MDTDLLEVGRWADDRASNQSAITVPRQESVEKHHLDPAAGARPLGSGLDRAKHVRSSRKAHRNRHPKSEDELLDRPPRDAIKEVRATQMIQRQHPACFVKAEGTQQGNEATAKLPGSFSRVERRLLKQASAYLLLDGHEVKFRKMYWSGP
ncbi:hypothetical protein F5Y12DRAFT_786102 [Xylaria sp. FL1777]|nr:hypothetical protein F5Y12DRAFT_786102 [Xylaria sp. FL1777]